MSRLPVLISVPHGGCVIPPEAQGACALDLPAILADGDTWSRDLYDFSGAVEAHLAADVARAVVDLNRAEEDRAPANPDGALKSSTLEGRPVWTGGGAPPEDLAAALLARHHRPYQARLEALARTPGLRLALDCHTMLAEAPPGGPGAGRPRPLFCLSNRGGAGGEDIGDGLSAPPPVLRALGAAFEDRFRELWDPASGRVLVALNDPFRGGYITRRHGLGGSLPWIQVEVNRCLYLDASRPRTAAPPRAVRERLDDLRGRVAAAIAAAL